LRTSATSMADTEPAVAAAAADDDDAIELNCDIAHATSGVF